MEKTKRSLNIIFVLFVLGISVGYGFQGGDGKKPLTSEARKVIRNQYGFPIRDANGQRINFSREQLQVQALQAPQDSRTDEAKGITNGSLGISGSEPFWSYAVFGTAIGTSGIIVAPVGDQLEIYLNGYCENYPSNYYWFALRYNADTGNYEQTYVSNHFPAGINRIRVGNVIGDSGNEIVVSLENGHILIYDQASKAFLVELTTSASDLKDLEIADVDSDGQNEFILCTSNHIYVYSGASALEWDLANVGGYDVTVGQMDNDSAMEIAVTSGQVIDAASHSVQWNLTDGFGEKLAVKDIDNDSKDELVVSEGWYEVRAYDVDLKLQKWTIPTDLDIGAINLVDIDNDSVIELLIGDGQWGHILAYDTVTQLLEWSIENPEHGVTNIATGDVDHDGITEVLWGAGETSSGPDYLYVANWQTLQIEWQNIHLDGPFIGPETGDLDGDGIKEIVAVSYASEAEYDSGRILVFDAHGMLRAISDPIVRGYAWTGTHDLKLYDVDGDGKMEIIVGADRLYDGVIEIYNFNADNTFTLNWTNSTRPEGSPFSAVGAGDIDEDGKIEIIGGVRSIHSGSPGIFIYVYDYTTGNEKWHSSELDDDISSLEIGDVDNDGSPEIIASIYKYYSWDLGYVYILNGKTQTIETTMTLGHSALTLYQFKNTSFPSIVVGDENGNIDIYTYTNGTYQVTSHMKHITGSIDGISFNPRDEKTIYFGSGGYLYIADSDTILWTSPCYGNIFGKRAAFLSDTNSFYSAGSYSIMGFRCIPAITVTSPDSTVNWNLGSIQQITWDACNVSGTLEISLWKDEALLGMIADEVNPSPGSYRWTTGTYIGGTATAGTGYKVKILVKGTTLEDFSDNSFTISPAATITLTSPNGGENWQSGSIENITWNAGYISGNLKINLWKDGVVVGTIAENLDPAAVSYPWTVGKYMGGTAPAGTGYTVKIKEKGTTVADSSDASFAISAPASITVTSPNGSENWANGSTQNITWNAVGLSGNVKITLWKNGVSVGTIANSIDPTLGSYSWTVGRYIGGTASAGTGYAIKIKEIGTAVADMSNATFTITGITITSPNGGESWQKGSTQNITWNAGGLSANMKITLWKDGVLVGTIVNNIPSSPGSYAWTVGQYAGGTASAGTGYTIRIKEIGTAVSDSSNSAFTLTN